ncbi:11530_t:CDS:2 [Entrophospora sp. SA101]|nr:11530_t:CDS:2 [Entrophospora sp. SA101]CAJ0911300.1 4240_t:CDS:2 [Entrophospora sp. SA101]
MTDNIHVASDLAKNQLYSDVAPEDLKWTLASGSSTETQTFYLSTKEGHFAFVQMIHSNIGSSGFVEHKFWPKGIVNGTFVVDGRKFDVSGTGLFVHAIQGMRPHLIASKWNFINFQSDISSLSMCEFEATPYYGGVKVNQGSLMLNDKLIGVSIDNKAEFVETELDLDTGYNIPKKINYVWEGRTLEGGEDYTVTIEIMPTILMDKIDVLNE